MSEAHPCQPDQPDPGDQPIPDPATPPRVNRSVDQDDPLDSPIESNSSDGPAPPRTLATLALQLGDVVATCVARKGRLIKAQLDQLQAVAKAIQDLANQPDCPVPAPPFERRPDVDIGSVVGSKLDDLSKKVESLSASVAVVLSTATKTMTYAQAAAPKGPNRPLTLSFSPPRQPLQDHTTRVTLSMKGLSPQHPLKQTPTDVILNKVALAALAQAEVQVKSVTRLASGDLALGLNTSREADKLLTDTSDWVVQALSSMGPLPRVNRPLAIASRSLVVHGVLLESNEATEQEEACGRIREDLERENGVEIRVCKWLVSASRRAGRHASSIIIELSSPEERAKLIQSRGVRLCNRILYVDLYRAGTRETRFQQCGNCLRYRLLGLRVLVTEADGCGR